MRVNIIPDYCRELHATASAATNKNLGYYQVWAVWPTWKLSQCILVLWPVFMLRLHRQLVWKWGWRWCQSHYSHGFVRLLSVSEEYGLHVLIYTLNYKCECQMFLHTVLGKHICVHISRKMIERNYWCPVVMSKSIQNPCDRSSETTEAQLTLPHSQHRLSLNEANLFIKHDKANCISTIIFVRLAVWQAPHWLLL